MEQTSPAGSWERLAETWKRLCLVSARLQAGDDTARKDQRRQREALHNMLFQPDEINLPSSLERVKLFFP